MIRPLLAAIALLAVAAPSAAAHGGGAPSDAEIFATNNTATITDQNDPRLDKNLAGFAERVTRIIRDGGGKPRGSELLDGVFCCELTFERSRRFAVDHVSDGELHDIAETIRRRFLQGSVLTFDHLHPHDPDADAVELDVPKVNAKALRKGLLDDPEAALRLFGGSVTLENHLLLVAGLEDADFARAFAKRIGGDLRRAETSYGRREFVSAQTDGRARIEQRTLTISGTPEDDTIALRDNAPGLEIDFGDDGVVDFEPSFRRFDRIRFAGGDGFDKIVSHAKEIELFAEAFDSIERIDLSDADRVTVNDLAPAGVQEVYVNLGDGVDRVTVNASEERDNILVGGFGDSVYVLGPTFVQINGPDLFDRLRVNGLGDRDDISASTDRMRLTLDGGDGGGTLFGGPGDDVLIGGDGVDETVGGKGDDVARMRGYFDRFTWRPGDGSDDVDGGGSHDSLFFQGTNDVEVFDFFRFGHEVRLVHDPGANSVDLRRVEELDVMALGGADVFGVRDLSGTGVDLVDLSLAGNFGAPDGDKTADRIDVDGTDGDDALKLVGKKVFAGTATLTGLPYTVNLTHTEPIDTLAIHPGAGDDTLDASGLGVDVIGLETE